MDTVICKEVVIATLTRRGKGVKHSPMRVITEIFEKDGTKIAENDPSPEAFVTMDLVNFARWCIENISVEVKHNHVERWLDSIETKK